jgi:hypothetical protein
VARILPFDGGDLPSLREDIVAKVLWDATAFNLAKFTEDFADNVISYF